MKRENEISHTQNELASSKVESTSRKPYVPPQLFRVELNQDQAILTACSLFAASLSNGGNRSCRVTGGGSCKNHRSPVGDSSPRVS